jgi:hypothetical protein
MDSPFDNRLTLAAAIGAVVLSVLAVWYWQGGAAPDAGTAASPAPSWDGPVGPGLASGEMRAGLAPLGANPEASREPGLATDAGGHLIPSLQLRKLMDSFLARGPASGRQARAEELRAFLGRKLAAPAAGEAERLVSQYLRYLDAEDQLLARERFTAPGAHGLAEREVERLLSFQEQRAQQRQRLLGPALAQAWFEAEDSRCGAALRDWQLQHVAPEPGQELDPVEIRERRIHGAALAERRDEDAQACAVEMSRGYAEGG